VKLNLKISFYSPSPEKLYTRYRIKIHNFLEIKFTIFCAMNTLGYVLYMLRMKHIDLLQYVNT